MQVYLDEAVFEYQSGNDSDITSLLNFLKSRGVCIEPGLSVLNGKKFVLNNLNESIDLVYVVKASYIVTKYAVFRGKSVKIEAHSELRLYDAVLYAITNLFRSTLPANILVRNINRIFEPNGAILLHNLEGKIIWISEENHASGVETYSAEETPKLTSIELQSSLKVLKNRVYQLENTPLISKYAKERATNEKLLKKYPTAQIKLIFPGGYLCIFEFDSQRSITSILDSLSQSININRNLLKFSIPRVNLEAVLNHEIYQTELFPRSSIYVNEDIK